MLKQEFLDKYKTELKKKTVEIYWDYRDQLTYEQVELIEEEGSDALFGLEEELYDHNIDYIHDMQSELAREILNDMITIDSFEEEYRKEAIEEYKEIFDCEPNEEEFLEYVKEEGYLDDIAFDYCYIIGVNMNIMKMVRNTPYDKVLYVEYGDKEFYDDRAISDLEDVMNIVDKYKSDLCNTVEICISADKYYKVPKKKVYLSFVDTVWGLEKADIHLQYISEKEIERAKVYLETLPSIGYTAYSENRYTLLLNINGKEHEAIEAEQIDKESYKLFVTDGYEWNYIELPILEIASNIIAMQEQEEIAA